MNGQIEHAARIVRCRCGDTHIKATYAIEGRFLILTTPFGVKKTALGLQDPGKLARRFLKRICLPACASACRPDEPTKIYVPDAAVIDAMRRADRPTSRRPKVADASRVV